MNRILFYSTFSANVWCVYSSKYFPKNYALCYVYLFFIKYTFIHKESQLKYYGHLFLLGIFLTSNVLSNIRAGVVLGNLRSL